ncbi:MAG: BCAM0308 family protein [Myxococcota bacterium]|nr:BCAM0308 family protein [Myxococcota bacterium]
MSTRPAPPRPPPRRDRLLREAEHDSYKVREKLPDPTACPDCGAMFRAGRWTWGSPPADARRTLCPACHRIHDGYPGGYLNLVGPFARQHRDEIVALARSVESREKGEHPLKRIMDVVDEEDGMLVTTTDPRLARNIGDAIHRAYQGELDYEYSRDESLLRVSWTR